MSLFSSLPPPWNLVLSIAAMTISCALVLDAGWMHDLVRGRDRPVRPAQFGLVASKFTEMSAARRAAYLAIVVFGVAPMMMIGPMGVRSAVSGTALLLLVAGVGAGVLLLFWAERRGHARVATLLASLLLAAVLVPYILAGSSGLRRYLIVVGLLLAILGLLYLSMRLHDLILGYRPRTRIGAMVRLVADYLGALAVMVGTFWFYLPSH
ncbi:hypothetical protein [Sphingomonas alpina]|uniref:Uncharacterized protein n=1 Tax=Sphingomonas alpina TaxID=653931 RepID=A0A7H0LDF7_9SPHN|nr:hypothetical protein [Sphingomonas alpina]QNQ07710.1 hypothetical protein H3Z74_12870 [Sphingomonas alpina]